MPYAAQINAPRRWRIHVGAHKTATTHMQQQLEALRPQLRASGTGFATLEQLRPVRALDLRPRNPLAWVGGAMFRRQLEKRIERGTALYPSMVMSEEDILGNAGAPLHPAFYPRAKFRVHALASALLAEGGGGLWISVRSLDRFLPAAYATALKHSALPMDSETLKRRVLANPPDWSSLINQLTQAAPGISITVWDYADYRINCHAIIEDLTGVKIDHLEELPDPPETQTPDTQAIRIAETLPKSDNLHARAARISEIYNSATGPRFTLFTPDETERLQSLHEHQLALIRKMPNVRFFEILKLQIF